MFKRTLLATLMAAASAAAYAQPFDCAPYCFSFTNNHCCECAPTLTSGLYLGAGVGFGDWRTRVNTDFVIRPPFTFAGQEFLRTEYNEGAESAFQEAFLGYGYRCNSLYVGAEVFTQYFPAHYVLNSKSTDVHGTANSYYAREWTSSDVGFRIRPGYFLSCNTLFYVPIGYVHGRYLGDTNASSNVQDFTKDIHGWQVGWGIEQPVTSNLSIRMGYLYTGFKEFTVTNEEIPDVALTRFRHYRPNYDQMVLDFVYNFGCAQPIKSVCRSFGNGLYLGVQGGRSTFKSNYRTDYVDLPNDPFPEFNTFPAIADDQNPGHGAFVGAFAGYGMTVCNNLFLGAEVFGDWDRVKWSSKNITFPPYITSEIGTGTTGDDYDEHYKIKNSYGVDLVPGYFLTCNTMLYGKIGEKRADFEHHFFQQNYDEVRHHFHANGVHFGVGLQTSLGCHLSLRTEFTHTSFQERHILDVEEAPIDPAVNPFGRHYHTKIEPNQNQYTIGLVYSF